MAGGEFSILLLAALLAAAVIVWPASIICRRAGYSPYLGLLAILQIANRALLWFLALSPWPSERTS